MNTHRMNITIPSKEFERLKNKPNKSAFITMAIREKLDAEEQERRAVELASAYRQDSIEEIKLIEEWDKLAGDAL